MQIYYIFFLEGHYFLDIQYKPRKMFFSLTRIYVPESTFFHKRLSEAADRGTMELLLCNKKPWRRCVPFKPGVAVFSLGVFPMVIK